MKPPKRITLTDVYRRAVALGFSARGWAYLLKEFEGDNLRSRRVLRAMWDRAHEEGAVSYFNGENPPTDDKIEDSFY